MSEQNLAGRSEGPFFVPGGGGPTTTSTRMCHCQYLPSEDDTVSVYSSEVEREFSWGQDVQRVVTVTGEKYSREQTQQKENSCSEPPHKSGEEVCIKVKRCGVGEKLDITYKI